MLNMIQACGVVAQQRGPGTLLVSTMASMFVFDMIEGAQGNASGVPLKDGKAGLILGLGVAKLKTLLSSPSQDEAAKEMFNTRLSSVPLMGGAAGLGLGLAMAQARRKVIVMDGDASLLMELGGLVTVAKVGPPNLIHVVVNNGTQFTGLANLRAPDPQFNFAEAARNAGYRSSQRISDPQVWGAEFARLLACDGPHFVELMVEPVPQKTGDGFEQVQMPDKQFVRMADEAQRMQSWLRQELA